MNLNKIYINLLSLIVNIIDLNNKRKIINFFKVRLLNDEVCIIDVGAHKGETIDLFFKNFSILKILAFEANPTIYKILKKKVQKKYSNKVKIFNYGIGEVATKKTLSIFNDSSSSTFNYINKNSDYYRRKKKFLTPFKINKSPLQAELETQIFPLSHFSEINKLKEIDVLKIDTEGYEYNILKGVNPNHFKKIKYIYFEHHYDLMIKKNYTYADIKKLLNNNNFYLSFKIKMNFRKTFEYVYENKK